MTGPGSSNTNYNYSSGSSGTAAAKAEALEAAGVKVGKTPTQTAEYMQEIMKSL